jgi:glycogen debranching enzyme
MVTGVNEKLHPLWETFAAPPISEFYIPATASLEERRPRTLKHGDTFAVFDPSGDIVSGEHSPEGLYHRDTRYLSHLHLSLMGKRPMLLSSTVRDDNAALICDLTNPDLFDGERRILERDLIHLRRLKFLWQSTCFERLTLHNFGQEQVELALEFRFVCDFADLFEVRGSHRPRRGLLATPVVANDQVAFTYQGLDDVRRTTQVSFAPAPDELEPNGALYRLRLPAGGNLVIFMTASCDTPVVARSLRSAFMTALRGSRRALRTSASRAASVATSNDIFNEGIRRSVSDLYMLITDKPQGPYPYAGIPWFSAVFGRDAIITALMTLWLDPAIARGVLGFLAANQATAIDPVADAEPGKILHELRQGEMAELGEVPFRRYYGSVDSTPLFVFLTGEYLRRTGDLATIRRLWPAVEAALAWIDNYGDRDRDGFVEYGRETEQGLLNQGWKDSRDSIFHADGSLAQGPIALCEVQAYVHAAKLAAAAMARILGDVPRAEALVASAARLRDRFNEAFWCEELGTYALALDGAKRRCCVRSSNVGHLLLTDIVPAPRAAMLARELMTSEFFSGWGVRTVATDQPRYNPMSYHNGSIWPHDNALIARGLAAHGFKAEAARILEGLFAASISIDLRRLPELFCGFPRRSGQGPTFYPVACSPQAWAAVTPLSLLQSCLGITFHVPSRTVGFDQPCLPTFLGEVVLRGLAIGEDSIDVALRQSDGSVAMHVLARHGNIRARLTS